MHRREREFKGVPLVAAAGLLMFFLFGCAWPGFLSGRLGRPQAPAGPQGPLGFPAQSEGPIPLAPGQDGRQDPPRVPGDLLLNGAFAAGSGGLAGWRPRTQSGANTLGSNTVRVVHDDPIHRNALELMRTDGGRDGGGAYLEQDLTRSVSGFSMLFVDAEVDVLSEEGGNIAGRDPKWYPEGAVQLRMSYLDSAGKPGEWYHGFYYGGVDRPDSAHFTKVTQAVWHTYMSENLKFLSPPPKTITKISVYGFGWNFKGRVADLHLIAR